ncbi:MAG TPA: carbonate dehydratase [Gammaproteobacteria bacterium]|nr:carbonate dehydratase [Gammaproteobacteria bacterium]
MAWADAIKASDARFFNKLSEQQAPEYLWIGCADSRVPANEIVGLLPGELFVHRNVANLVLHTDFNCLSVLQFAIEVLKVKHIIICGHYDCGGVKAAMECKSHGLVDNWLSGVKDIYVEHHKALQQLTGKHSALDEMCELNVKQQVVNLCRTTITQDAWRRGQSLVIHGWIYDVRDGVLKDLDVSVHGLNQLASIYRVE